MIIEPLLVLEADTFSELFESFRNSLGLWSKILSRKHSHVPSWRSHLIGSWAKCSSNHLSAFLPFPERSFPRDTKWTFQPSIPAASVLLTWLSPHARLRAGPAPHSAARDVYLAYRQLPPLSANNVLHGARESGGLTSALSACKHKLDRPRSSLISEITPARVWQIHQNKHGQSFQTSIMAVFSPWEPDPNPEAKQMKACPEKVPSSVFFFSFLPPPISPSSPSEGWMSPD